MEYRQTKSIICIAALLATRPVAAEPIFLSCEYDENVMQSRRIVITLNLETKLIRFEDFYQSGKTDETYSIIKSTDSEITAQTVKNDTRYTMTINRITGHWLVQFPIDKSQNHNLANEESVGIGYPPDVQLIGSYGGSCEIAKQKF